MKSAKQSKGLPADYMQSWKCLSNAEQIEPHGTSKYVLFRMSICVEKRKAIHQFRRYQLAFTCSKSTMETAQPSRETSLATVKP